MSVRVVTFPGLGAAYPQMLDKYRAEFPGDAATLDAWMARVDRETGGALFKAELRQQAEIHALNLLWWRREGVALAPAAVCGHSLGYYAALVAAGALDEEASFDLLVAVLRTLWPAFADNRQPIYVLTTRHPVDFRTLAAQHALELIAQNNGMQAVLYGAPDNWNSLTITMGDDMLRGVVLPTRVPFHSAAVRPLASALSAAIREAGVVTRDLQRPLWSHIDGVPIADREQAIALVASQPYRAVQWDELTRALCTWGATEFIEVGPNRVLTQIARLAAPQVLARFTDCLRRAEGRA